MKRKIFDLLLIITLLVTLLVLVPIDNELKQWTVATIPENWEAIRSKWDSFHTIRMVTSPTSLVCFVAAMMRRL